MKVGILGSGIVGRILARAFHAEGHEVILGTRDLSKLEVVKFKEENSAIGVCLFDETVASSDLCVLSVKGDAAINAIDLAGRSNFKGKIVIDTTNPISPEPPVNGVLKFFTGPNSSLMENIQEAIPDAFVVKAFSCVGNPFMYKPDFNGQVPTMFICGNDPAAKETVTTILDSFGWETEDMGLVESARAIEPLCVLWCIPGMINGNWSHAFKLLKK